MSGAGQLMLQFTYWYLLSICVFVASNSNNTCEVICLCFPPPTYWNQLKCCPNSLLQKKVASSSDDQPSMPDGPAYDYPMPDDPADDYPMPDGPSDYYPMPDGPADYNPMLDGPVGGGLMYDNPVGGGPMYDNPVGGGPMYDNPVGGGPMYDNPVGDGPMYDSPVGGGPMYDSPVGGGPMYDNSDDDGPMLDSPVADDSPVSTPSVRVPRSPNRGQGIHAMKKRSGQEKASQNSSCVYSFVYTEPLHREFLKHLYNDIAFRVFHYCLQKHIGSEFYLKCQGFRNVSTLESAIPVVDRKTNIIYANRFCAECNDIDDFEVFHHEFVCSNEILGHWDFLSLEQTEENQLVLLRSGLCVYSLKPPDNKTLNTAGNRCMSAKYTDCNQAEEAVVSDFDWETYKSSVEYLEDGEYCALCGYQRDIPAYSDIGQFADNNVQRACTYGECLDKPIHVMSYSFFILMSLDKALLTTADDRAMKPSHLTCGNQSDYVYDKYMVRNIPSSDLHLNIYISDAKKKIETLCELRVIAL